MYGADLFGTSAMGLNFTAAGFLPLPEITAIGFTTPLLIVVFASLMLGERVGVYRISAVLVGLIGVLIIVEPRLTFDALDPAQDAMMLGVILAITAAACAALAQIQIRKMVQVERASAIIFYFCITASVFSLSYRWNMGLAQFAANLNPNPDWDFGRARANYADHGLSLCACICDCAL